jgi:hypothetical protein
VGARFSEPLQTGPGAHTIPYTMGTGGKVRPGFPADHSPLLVPRSWKSRAITLPTLWATTGPVKGTLYLYLYLLRDGSFLTCRRKEMYVESWCSSPLKDLEREESNIYYNHDHFHCFNFMSTFDVAPSVFRVTYSFIFQISHSYHRL